MKFEFVTARGEEGTELDIKKTIFNDPDGGSP